MLQIVHSGGDKGLQWSRDRWLKAEPNLGLTWGVKTTGTAYVEALIADGLLTPHTRILEIGPGYGRLLGSLHESGAEFKRYVGLDISEKVVDYLSDEYPQHTFLLGDASEFPLTSIRYDLVISSLVFKHIYPHFGQVLAPLVRAICRPGWVTFDFKEPQVDTYLSRDILKGHGYCGFEKGVAGERNFIRAYTQYAARHLIEWTRVTSAGFEHIYHQSVDGKVKQKRVLVKAFCG